MQRKQTLAQQLASIRKASTQPDAYNPPFKNPRGYVADANKAFQIHALYLATYLTRAASYYSDDDTDYLQASLDLASILLSFSYDGSPNEFYFFLSLLDDAINDDSAHGEALQLLEKEFSLYACSDGLSKQLFKKKG
jgi:hypothetical protein